MSEAMVGDSGYCRMSMNRVAAVWTGTAIPIRKDNQLNDQCDVNLSEASSWTYNRGVLASMLICLVSKIAFLQVSNTIIRDLVICVLLAGSFCKVETPEHHGYANLVCKSNVSPWNMKRRAMICFIEM
jgi:hypothetical protein